MERGKQQVSTKSWGNPLKARILVIGHDPRLQDSSTIAPFALFADYHFKYADKPANKNEAAKYGLAEKLYTCIQDLTGGNYSDSEIVVTNLCNEELPKSPGRKTVYIPEDKAKVGIRDIRRVLEGSNIRLIFAMSEQVNYWLQKLGFYESIPAFLEKAAPLARGLINMDNPYYEHTESKAFKLICGKRYMADSKYSLFPILHVNSYNVPLSGNLSIYEEDYNRCRRLVQSTIAEL